MNKHELRVLVAAGLIGGGSFGAEARRNALAAADLLIAENDAAFPAPAPDREVKAPEIGKPAAWAQPNKRR